MSALDKAFLRAYTKGAAVPGSTPNEPAAEPSGATAAGIPAAEAPPANNAEDEGIRRIDAAHHPAGSPVPPPHAPLAAAAICPDLAMAGPMQEVISPPPPPPVETSRLPAIEPEAAVVDPVAEPSRSPQGESEPLVTADAPKPPPAVRAAALQLPAVFLAPEDVHPAQHFSPDWEVDRFAWPDLCQRLLDVESRYFRHVGQRLKAATDESHHVLMISGCRRGEGRTTLALCLARSAAQAGVQVALLDADLQNPQLGPRLGMETPCGWMDVLSGQVPLKEAAVTSLEDQLTLFPLKPPHAIDIQPGDLRLIHVVRRISVHYPLVLVDTGPLERHERHPFAGEDDCPIDAAIVVRDLRHTTEKKTMAAAARLQHSGIAAVGIAENFEAR